MFTGLVECVGRVAEIDRRDGGCRLTIASSLPLESVADGDSIAVDGVCLTVAARRGDRFSADAIPETLRVTTLGALESGSRVNLERALRVGDRLGGHWVQGHVDATAAVRSIRRGDDWRVEVELNEAIARFVAHKGSVTLAGVSLTVAAIGERSFEVALIPTTLAETTLGDLAEGDRLNVEVDLLARYLERLIARDG